VTPVNDWNLRLLNNQYKEIANTSIGFYHSLSIPICYDCCLQDSLKKQGQDMESALHKNEHKKPEKRGAPSKFMLRTDIRWPSMQQSCIISAYLVSAFQNQPLGKQRAHPNNLQALWVISTSCLFVASCCRALERNGSLNSDDNERPLTWTEQQVLWQGFSCASLMHWALCSPGLRWCAMWCGSSRKGANGTGRKYIWSPSLVSSA
jgi:hypothetical protein